MTELQPVPAATVVLAREYQDDLQVLLLHRNASLVFNGGNWVFPGGKIDQADYLPDGSALEYPAARQAAVRETREEAGIEIPLDALIHTAHWTTPPNLPRRYSTWFFVCPLRHAVEVRVDRGEIMAHQWISPTRALAEYGQQKLRLPHPTRSTLQDLAHFTSLAQLEAELQQADIRVFPNPSPYYRPEEMGFFRPRPVI